MSEQSEANVTRIREGISERFTAWLTYTPERQSEEFLRLLEENRDAVKAGIEALSAMSDDEVMVAGGFTAEKVKTVMQQYRGLSRGSVADNAIEQTKNSSPEEINAMIQKLAALSSRHPVAT